MSSKAARLIFAKQLKQYFIIKFKYLSLADVARCHPFLQVTRSARSDCF